MYRSLAAPASLLRELRRRHVFRVALVYGAVAWVILEVSATLIPALHLPEWAVTLVALLAILGFPVALVLAWAFDLTPEGIRRTSALDGDEGGAAATPPPAPREAAGEPGPAEPAPRPPVAPLRSLAALPFVDRGPTGQHQYLGDGITEELINGLARVAGLRVVSRTSAFALRGQDVDVREIGARLGVGSVLEGSVGVSGDRLRMTVQLVSVVDGYALWSETYDRRMEDVFTVQEEVARAIVEALRSRLAAEDASLRLPADAGEPLLVRSTDDLEAYRLYLRGRAHWNERTPDAIQRAIEYFRRAAAADPGFAHAYAGLADGYAILLDYGVLAPAAALPPAREAAERALRLGPDLAEAHTSVGLLRQMECDWGAAEERFRRAIELNPGYVVARHRYGLFLAWMGRLEESRRQMDAARRLDPLSPVVGASLGWIAYYGGSFEEAARIEREVLAEHPGFWTARVPLALAELRLERVDAALAELKAAVTESGAASSALSLLAFALARAGRGAEALEVGSRLQQRAGREYVSPYYLAIARLATGDEAAALRELERAAAERSPQVVYLRMEPLFAKLREGEAFRRLLARVGLA